MRIFAVDPGVKNIGRAILTPNEIVEASTYTIDMPSYRDQLMYWGNEIDRYISQYSPTVLIYEAPTFNGRGKNGAYIHEMLGVLQYKCFTRGIQLCYRYTPQNVKKTLTGRGVADKKEVEDSLWRYYKRRKFDKDHASDAVAIGLTYFITEGFVS
jgi:Holliday junction resolvasome RuvABC endonuclease subunit